MPTPTSQSHGEKPLGRVERLFLILFATTVMLLSYAFAVTSMVLLCTLLALEILVALAAARFGLAVLVTRLMERHFAVTAVFFRCIRLSRGPDLGFSLERHDAPPLFEKVEGLCEKLHVQPPSVVWIMNGTNAHVELKGFRRGGGRTILGIGYDLLAGLAEPEVEAVLAHEMAHAKLIQRGLKTWLSKGLRRLVLLSQGLSGHANNYRRAKRKDLLAELLLLIFRSFTLLTSKLVASYSRQDEFDADRVAAGLCGVAAMRACLLKLRPLAEVSGRLPWRERVARLQVSGSFSQWLLEELASVSALTQANAPVEVFNAYSTHPAIADRLAALGPPPDQDAIHPAAIALTFLTNPDAVADKLVRQIHRVAADQEKRDSRILKHTARKLAVGMNVRWGQLWAIAMFVVGLMIPIMSFGDLEWIHLLVVLVLFGGGILLYRFARFKDSGCLPAPDFGALRRWTPGENVQKRAEQLETQLRNLVSVEQRSRARRERLIHECHAALANCDYLRAHVAGRLLLQEKSKSPDGLIGLSIAAMALGDFAAADAAFTELRKLTGFRTASTAWAGGWTLALAGQWMQAEALLQRAAVFRPGDATVHSLLALVQSRRGKLHSAIDNARRASGLKPGKNEHSRQLTMLLLEAGSIREAQPRLAAVQHDATSDPELAMAMVRLHLTLGQFEQAEKWTGTVTGFAGRPHLLLRLGEAYEMSRKPDRAAAFYRASLQAAHYPEAWQGLGRIEAHQANRVDAERCFLAALDGSRTVGANGRDWLECMPNTLAALIGLRDPVTECKGWIAVLPPDLPVPPLNNRSMLVFARGKQEAQQLLETILVAIDHRMTSHTHQVQWRSAPRDYQPAGPVRPGVEALLP